MTLYPSRLHRLAQRCLVAEAQSSLRHALRNQVGTIRNANWFLKSKVDATPLAQTEPRIGRFFGIVDQQVEAVVAALEASATVLGPAALEPGDLGAVARRLVAEAAFPGTIQVEASLEGKAPVHAALDEVELALYCLVENAVDALEAAGRGRLEVALAASANQVSIEVRDDGAGFAPGALDRAFEPFFSTRAGRTGLGLNIARRLAARARGKVVLEPRASGGVRATLVLPASAR